MTTHYSDRVVVCGIAVEQLVLSLLGLWLALAVPYGGGIDPGLAAYAAWGLVSALLLFSGKLFARIIALPWHLVFSAYFIYKSSAGHPRNQTDRIVEIWAYCDLLAIAYLIVTVVIQGRGRRTTAQEF